MNLPIKDSGRKRRTRAWIAIACVAAAATAALFVCPGRPKILVHDLKDRLLVADHESPFEVLLFGHPSVQPHLAEGVRREVGEASYAWANAVAELSFTWGKVESRRAVIDMAPSPGVRSQVAQIFLNGQRQAAVALNDVRHRYAFNLSADAQRVGENRLRLVFARAVAPAPGDKRQLAARLFGLVISRADDWLLDDLLQRGAPFVFDAEPQDGAPAIAQIGPSALRFAIELPVAAELRFRPGLHPMAQASAGRARMRVTYTEASGREHELWRAETRAVGKGGAEVALRLPGRAGEIGIIGLHVDGTTAERFSWAVWTAPRVMGSSPVGSWQKPLYSKEEQSSGETIRQAIGPINVILIVLDAARADHVGCYGYGRKTTPEIDRIAADGIVFERAYTPAVYTLAAMSSVWLSQQADRHHGGLSFNDDMPRDRLTLAELLSARQILSAAFIANAMAGKAKGFERGFDEFHEIFGDEQLGSKAELFRRSLHPWVRQHDGTRFFLYMHVREPHFPYEPPAPFNTAFGPDAPLTYLQRTDRAWYTDVNQGRKQASREEFDHLVRLYDGNIAYADHEVGELRRVLETAGLWEKSVVIVMADHGEQLGERGFISHGAQVYEASARVPLIVRLPSGKGPRGVRIGGLVDLTDIAPTVADLFGVMGQGGSERSFEGRSLLPMIGGARGKDAVIVRSIWDRPIYALRRGDWKYIWDSRSGVETLYDVVKDPDEQSDLGHAQWVMRSFLRQSTTYWIVNMGTPEVAAGAESVPYNRAQCENLCALGYIDCASCRDLK
ncbi:MAG: sulfatase [Vicinamibacteria bacterium]|jgi:arylsulfatase A-like enzyme|nr:sulfatase [Vicinamibacteria bacterium]